MSNGLPVKRYTNGKIKVTTTTNGMKQQPKNITNKRYKYFIILSFNICVNI